VIELVDVPALVRLWRVHTARLGAIYGFAARVDFIAALAALVGVLVFDTLPGLFIGIVASVVLLVYRTSQPHVAVLGRSTVQGHWVDRERHHDLTTVAGVVVARPEAGLFYANADNVYDAITEEIDDATNLVVVDLATVPFVDVTATEMLIRLDDDLGRDGITLTIARDVGQVRDLLAAAGAGHLIDRVYPTVEDAVRADANPRHGRDRT
jgi:MFS superfamily sulfate permease-like transporter